MNRQLSSPALCAILAHEKERGNTAVQEQTGWSAMDLVIVMKEPLDRDYAEQTVRVTDTRSFTFSDPHYGKPQYGVISGRESIVGPAPDYHR